MQNYNTELRILHTDMLQIPFGILLCCDLAALDASSSCVIQAIRRRPERITS